MTQTILLMLLGALVQDRAASDLKPLPELNSFLQDVREHLHSDEFVQSQYTYTERTVFRQLDSGGRTKKTETKVYEVYPSLDERFTYRRLTSKDNKPLSAEEIRREDSAFDKKRREWEHKLERENEGDRKHRESEQRRKEEEDLNEAFRLYAFTMIGREQLEGIPVIALGFEPRSDYKPQTETGKMLSKVRGKAWVTEADQQLVHLEAELIDSMSFGLGILARLNKGTCMVFERRRVNNEVWLPAESRFSGTGKILALKSFRVDQETIYSDYKKFSVETLFNIGQRKPPAKE